MEYHAITHNDYCVIRPANHGISNTEWLLGCRIFYKPNHTKVELEKLTGSYYVCDEREWSQYILSLDDSSNVPNNNFISTRVVYDKWDNNRPIY